jgi:hypothetical protein
VFCIDVKGNSGRRGRDLARVPAAPIALAKHGGGRPGAPLRLSQRAPTVTHRRSARASGKCARPAERRPRPSLRSFVTGSGCSSPCARRTGARLSRSVAAANGPERLSESSQGQALYELANLWADGATHVLLDRLELSEKLCVLIPAPRTHLLRYHGVLAPHAASR